MTRRQPLPDPARLLRLAGWFLAAVLCLTLGVLAAMDAERQATVPVALCPNWDSVRVGGTTWPRRTYPDCPLDSLPVPPRR